MIYGMILMIEADVFEEEVQMFEFLPRRLLQVRNLLLEEDVLSECRGKSRIPRTPILLLEIANLFLL